MVFFYLQNLYGGAQLSLLPYNNFEWVSPDVFKKINWKKISTEDYSGYVLEVDLLYPPELFEKHSDFPLAPENIEINYNHLSPYSQKALRDLDNKKVYKDRKLVGTFHTRHNYVIHFKNLKLYLELGMKLVKIHKCIKFHQKDFIAPFIEKCTKFRQLAKTKFEQDQFKKVANCVYGKTIQNQRNHVIVKLHTNIKSYRRSVSDSSFKFFTIIGENLVQTTHSQQEIKHDKPIYAGFSILELSKHFMFDFFYNKLCKDLPCRLELGMSDTDSLLFKVSNAKLFRRHVHKFMDYSNYPSNHPFFSMKNKSKLGFFKDELAGKYLCTEFIGLKSKCYGMNLKDLTLPRTFTNKKVCKGLGRLAIKNRLQFEHYKQCLLKNIPKRLDFHVISSRKHKITTKRVNKKALTHFDSKRYIFSCGIHSEPYGSNLLKYKCKKCKNIY